MDNRSGIECREKIHPHYTANLRDQRKTERFGKSSARRSRPRFLKCPTGWLMGATIFILHAKRTARTDDGRHPLVQVIPLRSRAAVRRRFERDFCQLFLDSPRAARQRALLVAHRLRCRLSIVVHAVEAFGCVRSVTGFSIYASRVAVSSRLVVVVVVVAWRVVV